MMHTTDLSHSIHLLAEDCKKDSEFWFPGLHEKGKWEVIVHYTLGLAGEVGELANLIKKANRGDEIDKEIVRGEIADVFIYLLDLSHALNVNVIDAYENKHMELVERWGARP